MIRLPWPVILASASPRRVELLGTVLAEFEVIPANLDEEALTTSDPVETALALARAKAHAVARRRPDALVVGADTVVAIDSVQLAKPSNPEDAIRMLQTLSGRTHRVITGVCLVWKGGDTSFFDSTSVIFKTISQVEIERYVASGEPFDKAGGYAIQGGATSFVEAVEGSLSNVVGLPMEKLSEAMQDKARCPCFVRPQATGPQI